MTLFLSSSPRRLKVESVEQVNTSDPTLHENFSNPTRNKDSFISPGSWRVHSLFY